MSGAKRASDIFQLHNVLTSRIADTGAVMLGLGDLKSEESADEDATLLQTSGVVSVPPVGAETLSLETSSGYITIASRDIRSGKIAGNMQPAETTVYAPGSQACELFKLDGSVTRMTTEDGTETGATVYDRMAKDEFTMFARWGKRTFDATGYHLFTFSGARLDMGGIGGLPPPLNSLGSYAKLSARIVQIEGSIVSIGPRAGVADAVAKATPLLLALSALNGVLAALLVPGAYVSATPGAPAVPGPGLIAAITTAQATLAAAPTVIPSQSTTVT
jgi:hypothetical protein